MIEERVRKVIVCDGCDYDISGNQRYMELTLPYKLDESINGKIVFHFHEVDKEHDCLRFWMTGPHIMERSLDRRELLVPNKAKQLILSSCKHRSVG